MQCRAACSSCVNRGAPAGSWSRQRHEAFYHSTLQTVFHCTCSHCRLMRSKNPQLSLWSSLVQLLLCTSFISSEWIILLCFRSGQKKKDIHLSYILNPGPESCTLASSRLAKSIFFITSLISCGLTTLFHLHNSLNFRHNWTFSWSHHCLRQNIFSSLWNQSINKSLSKTFINS